MTEGYALVAYPTSYKRTGRYTFIVNKDGRIFQNDLGAKTEDDVKTMTEFNPDPNTGWKLVEDPY